MKNRNRNLDDALAAIHKDALDPDAETAAGQRAWQRIEASLTGAEAEVAHIRGCSDVRLLLPAFHNGHLPASRALLVEDHLRDCAACRRYEHGEAADAGASAWAPEAPAVAAWHWRRWAAGAAIAAAVVLAIVLVNRILVPSGARATLQSAQGTVYRIASGGAQPVAPGATFSQGDLVRTATGGHAYLRLLDGSLVEMASGTQLAVQAGRKDTTIQLDGGRVIVQAAKRSSGHLYVKARDIKVAVTGTVFSVDSGLKGSRVAVVEGTVEVATNSGESTLHSGDEMGTGGEGAHVSVAEEIAWSHDREKHLALLAEFAKLQKNISENVQVPAPRHESALLPLVPADAILYVSIPNLGEAIAQANQIFQQQLQESSVLREWWNDTRNPRRQADFSAMVERIQTLSRYLGDEAVFTAFGTGRKQDGGAMIAAIKTSGLRTFLEDQAQRINAESHGGKIVVVDPAQLAAMRQRKDEDHLFALVRNDYLVVAPSLESLRRVNDQLNAGASGFAGTDFGQAIAASYTRGAGILIGANLQAMEAQAKHRGRDLKELGFSNVRFLILEHREENREPDNRATIDFSGARTGVASWLASPAPIRSLDFVSPSASIVIAGIAKSPAAMLDDILAISAAHGKKGKGELTEMDRKLGVNVRDEVAASLGGDFTVALDGPPLPTPSWKAVVEVTNQAQLESALERMIAAANRELAAHKRPQIVFSKNEDASPPDYSISGANSGLQQLHYTFAHGFMILGPTRAMVLQAVQIHGSGVTLPVSQGFQALLPRDGQPNVSGVFYQNLAPMLGELSGQISSAEMQSLRQIAADTKPTVVVAYGGNDRIQVASTARFPDLNSMAFSALLGGQKRNRTSAPSHP